MPGEHGVTVIHFQIGWLATDGQRNRIGGRIGEAVERAGDGSVEGPAGDADPQLKIGLALGGDVDHYCSLPGIARGLRQLHRLIGQADAPLPPMNKFV